MSFPRFLLLFCMFLFALFACSSSNDGFVSVEELHNRISNNHSPILLDVRSEKEFKQGYIEGAIHIPIKQLPKQLSQLEDKKNDEIVVYCHGGPRARKAIKLLNESGFTQVIELKEHYKGWKKAGLPITK